MNFALPALIILLFVLPGIALVKSFSAPLFNKRGFELNEPGLLFLAGLCLALPVNWIGWKILGCFFTIDLEAALSLAVNTKSDSLISAVKDAARASDYIVSYFTLLIFGSVIYGYSLRFFTVFFKFDEKYFSPGDKWHNRYYPGPENEYLASAVVERPDGSHLYRGKLEALCFDSKQELEGYWISTGERRTLQEDDWLNPSNEVFYQIPSENVYIRAGSLTTISVMSFEPKKRLRNIRESAYRLYEFRKENSIQGNALSDWCISERLVDEIDKKRKKTFRSLVLAGIAFSLNAAIVISPLVAAFWISIKDTSSP